MLWVSEHLPSPVDTPQSQFKSRSREGKLGSLKSLQLFPPPHIQPRGGSYAELSCLKSEVNHQWTAKSWCLLHSSFFSQVKLPGYMLEVVSLEPSSLFYFWTCLSICFTFWSHFYTLLWDITGCSFLLCASYQTVLSECSQSEVTLRIWVQYQFSIISV